MKLFVEVSQLHSVFVGFILYLLTFFYCHYNIMMTEVIVCGHSPLTFLTLTKQQLKAS